MILDFKEIPQANKANGLQDYFELFARDFLSLSGYRILQNPFRGADGKCDLIVVEKSSNISNAEIKWLVSCKHNAHSGKSVTDKDEANILDRIKIHKCDGFMGFYSTLPSTSLANNLHALTEIKHVVLDCGRIDDIIVSSPKFKNLMLRYFPKSFESNRDKLFKNKKQKGVSIDKSSLIEGCLTAGILIEIIKIKEKYWSADWPSKPEVIKELDKYLDYSNDEIIKVIIDFFHDISLVTRANMSIDMAGSLYWSILTFFPGLHGSKGKQLNFQIQIAHECIQIGYNMVYDAFIHLRNLNIAMYGLTVLKLIFRLANENDIQSVIFDVKSIYKELKSSVDRKERKDLGNAKIMLKVFEADLSTWDLAFPILPEGLMTIIENERRTELARIKN